MMKYMTQRQEDEVFRKVKIQAPEGFDGLLTVDGVWLVRKWKDGRVERIKKLLP